MLPMCTYVCINLAIMLYVANTSLSSGEVYEVRWFELVCSCWMLVCASMVLAVGIVYISSMPPHPRYPALGRKALS